MTGVRSNYDLIADRYDVRWSRYIRETTEATLALVDPRPGSRILDVGCGTGELLGRLARLNADLGLWGVDTSIGMLRRAARRCETCQLVTADAASLPFADGSFDTLTSSSSLHHWPDPRIAFAEAHRVLSPGGRFVLTDWCRDLLFFRPFAAYLRLTDRSVERVYSSGELQELLAAAGFSVRQARVYRAARFWGMVTVSAARAHQP